MRFSTIIASLALAVPALAQLDSIQSTGEQMILNDIHNTTSLGGSWSTGSKNVVTGPQFASPNNMSFHFPKTTGISFSFTNDGFFELAQYRIFGNGSQPNCLTAMMLWDHGRYTILANGSIVTQSFGDGYQQVQNACAAVSNFIQPFNANNETTLYQQFRIFTDLQDGYKLHIFQFDGTPFPPQFQVSATPIMFPTRNLHNTTTAAAAKRSLKKRSAGERSWASVGAGAIALVVAAVASVSL
ncbi:hypothetical protein BDW22DRAFT_1325130 [Trametopsis cervina]|nr:hypothetical protein BDW22DRAFT_1325130 [Trametopsis cervina]